MILAGDVGGTNTRLAWCEAAGAQPDLKRVRRFRSREHPSLTEIVKRFLEETGQQAEAACFGVAGPVRDGRARISNLPWEVDSADLAELLGLDGVLLANDLEASAYGIASLAPSDFAVLNEGSPDAAGNEALISAGTGLGEAGLHWEGDCHRPFPSEGGHADFAPSNEMEAELLAHLWKEHGHVSWERVVSGPGLNIIYMFLRDTGCGEEPEWLSEELRGGDPSPLIAEHGLSGRSELCSLALDTFVSIYGAEAGNLALKLMATAGVFVGGGIAPKILLKLQEGRFFRRFAAKGRMAALLERIPVRVILNDRCALLGAARLATLSPREC